VNFQEREGLARKTRGASIAYVSLFAFCVASLVVSLIGALPSYVMIGLLVFSVSSYSVPIFNVKVKKQKVRAYETYIALYPLIGVFSHLCFSIGFLKRAMFPTKKY
jgi:hypothetical protein